MKLGFHAALAMPAVAPSTRMVGAALWAVGMGAQDSIFKAAIAQLVAKEHRGRAYGIFFATFGLAWSPEAHPRSPCT